MRDKRKAGDCRLISLIKDGDAAVLARLAAIFGEVFRDEPMNCDFMTDEAALAYLSELLAEPKPLAFAFFSGETVIGGCFGRLRESGIRTFEIGEIFVEKASRGKGGEFLAEIEAALVGDGVSAIRITTDRKIPAFRFYRKNGFEVMEDVINMIKFID